MGKLGAPSLAALTSSLASETFLISEAPAPCFSTLLSGQPMFISTPSKPSFAISSAAPFICSGEEVKNCATIGRSASLYSRSFKSFFLPASGARAKPSAETNSVHITLGFPYLAIMRRNATSVTSAIGAKTIIGRSSFCQKLFTSDFILNHFLSIRFLTRNLFRQISSSWQLSAPQFPVWRDSAGERQTSGPSLSWSKKIPGSRLF